MTMKQCYFVGGPFDGQWLDVPTESIFIKDRPVTHVETGVTYFPQGYLLNGPGSMPIPYYVPMSRDHEGVLQVTLSQFEKATLNRRLYDAHRNYQEKPARE
jgi:hypothetical protein